MKKNINMNLFGTLYAIDEDAYELLNRYLENMKRYFSRKEGGEEIADDIEHRMAELLSELKAEGVEAISIEHVKGIIERIGSPEEMEGFDTPENTENNENTGSEEEEETDKGHKGAEWFRKFFSAQSKKKLFRNPDDQIIGGVLSGIASYTDIDAIWFRLLTVLLLFFSFGTVVLIYLLLWLIIPLASSPEDRLRMKGTPVNMENIHDEIINETKRQTEKASSQRHPTVNLFLKIIIISFLCVVFLPLIGILLLFLFIFSIIVFGLVSNSGNILIDSLGTKFQWLKLLQNGDNTLMFWVTAVSFILLLALSIYLLVHIIRNMFGRTTSLTASQRTVLIISWLLLFIVGCASFTHCIVLTTNYEDKIYKQEKMIQDSVVRSKDSVYLAQQGWRIVKSRNSHFYTYSGKYYTGDKARRYIAGDAHKGLLYEVEKTAKVAPGKYRLKAVARTDGNGCQIFLYNGKQRYAAKVPVGYSSGGNLWENAVERIKKHGESVDSVSKYIAEANDGKGYGWNEVVIEPVIVKDSSVRYGITNDCPDEAWTGTWFTATDFVLERIE